MCAVGSTLIAAGSSSSASAGIVSSQLPAALQVTSETSSQPRPVTVQVLGRSAPTVSNTRMPKVNFNVKIFNSDNKKERQVFVLRDVSREIVSTPESVMQEMRKQFGSHVQKKHPFPVGYMKGGMKVSIRTRADISDIWLQVSRAENVILWCEGVRDGDGSDSDEDAPRKPRKKRKKISALEEKNERVQETVQKLRKKHNDRYTTIQYRLWSEMIDVGTHK